MANRKTVPIINSILTLYKQERPKLQIAKDLGIDVKTVRSYIRQAEEANAGGETTGSNSLFPPAGDGGSNSLLSPPGKIRCGRGRPSKCEPYREQIEQWLESGLQAQRIYQDLVIEYDFAGSYDSVKRFCRHWKEAHPERIHRIECLPGEEAQVDFGQGFYIEDAQGKRRKANLLRVVLSHSRKGYTEAVSAQTSEHFVRCLENAFRYFGGVPQTLNIDNLRAAVTKPDWYEPELTPKIESFCRHYGTVVLPCRVGRPEHKGKVENSIKYVKNNALKGRRFPSLQSLNEHLRNWESTVADRRIHGTTRQQVGKRFLEMEKDALQALPPNLFPCFKEGQRSVHRDAHVEVGKAYYEVPEEYIGKKVWVRWDTRLVRVFNQRFEQIAVLAVQPPGTFTQPLGARGRPHGGAQRDKAYWLRRCARIGDHCGLWALEIIAQRGAPGVRVLQGLVHMTRAHRPRQIDQACELALSHGAYRLSDLRRLMDRPTAQQTLGFMQDHPLIRDMREYTDFLEELYPHDELINQEVTA